jgi:hypothetical protein
VISRYFLIVLAVGVGLYRATQGAWLAAGGLLTLSAGLVVLKLAERSPRLRPFAYACFLATAASVAVILIQRRQ